MAEWDDSSFITKFALAGGPDASGISDWLIAEEAAKLGVRVVARGTRQHGFRLHMSLIKHKKSFEKALKIPWNGCIGSQRVERERRDEKLERFMESLSARELAAKAADFRALNKFGYDPPHPHPGGL